MEETICHSWISLIILDFGCKSAAIREAERHLPGPDTHPGTELQPRSLAPSLAAEIAT